MLPDTLREAARRFGDSVAYVAAADWPLTYADLDRVTDEVAAGLAARGVGEGDVVGLVLPPGVEYLVCYLALAKLGAITAGVNDRLAAPERAAVLELAGPELVIAAPGSRRRTARRRSKSRHGRRRSRTCSPTCAYVRRRRPPLADDPDRDGRDHLHVGHHRHTEGRALRQPPAALHHRHRRRRRTGACGGRSLIGTSCATLGFMTKLPGNLRRGGDHVHDGALVGARGARAHRARAHDVERRRADPGRARCSATPTSTPSTSRACSRSSFGGGPAHARASPRRRAPDSARPSRRATRAPRPASGSAPRSTPTRRTRS